MAKNKKQSKPRPEKDPNRRYTGRPLPQVTEQREMEAIRLSSPPHFWTYDRIADKLGVTRSAVCKMIARGMKTLAAEWAEEQYEVRIRHTQYLRHVAMESMDAFERSKVDSITISERQPEKKADGSKPDKPEITKTTKGQCGDPRFLAEARGAWREEREMWGFNAPAKQDITGEVTANIGGFMTKDQLYEEAKRRIAAGSKKTKSK